MKKIRKMMAIALIVFGSIVLLCGNSLSADKITFAYVDWPGVTIKTHVASQILTALGYEAKLMSLSVPVVFKGLSNKDLDIFLGAWLPTMKSISDKYFQDGSITEVAVNLDETVYTLAVPGYAWKEGVKSHADLNKFADKFDGKIIGIEPGNDGNKLVLDMIKNNTYNLKNWKLIESSAEAMMISVGASIKKKEWVVWLGWSPHWMNLAYDVKYLKDPEKIWGSEPEVVKTVARSDLQKTHPNVYKMFGQFQVTPSIQNEWINKYSREKQKPDHVARTWIKGNLGIVDQWVYGIPSTDGRRGRDAVREYFK